MNISIIAASRLRAVNALQELKNACRIYMTLDNSSRNGLIITPEKGNGTISSSASNSATGVINQGALIDTVSKILLGNANMNTNNGLINSNVFSFSFWRKPYVSPNASGNFELMALDNSSMNYSSYMNNNSTLDIGIATRATNGAANNYRINSYALSSGLQSGFNHIYGHYNTSNNESKLFVNGVEQTSFTIFSLGSQNTVSGNALVRVGSHSVINNSFILKTAIDEVGFFYGIEATQERANILYNSGNGLQLF